MSDAFVGWINARTRRKATARSVGSSMMCVSRSGGEVAQHRRQHRDHRAGDARVVVKLEVRNREQLERDLEFALAQFGVGCSELRLLKRIELFTHDLAQPARPHL